MSQSCAVLRAAASRVLVGLPPPGPLPGPWGGVASGLAQGRQHVARGGEGASRRVHPPPAHLQSKLLIRQRSALRQQDVAPKPAPGQARGAGQPASCCYKRLLTHAVKHGLQTQGSGPLHLSRPLYLCTACACP